MTTSFSPGPSSEIGIKPPVVGIAGPTGARPAQFDINPDAAPGLYWMGSGVRDPEYMPRPGGAALVSGAYANQDIGWYWSDGFAVCDQVPSALSTTTIAAAQAPASGTPLTLQGANGGVTLVPAGGYTSLCNGLAVPANTLVLDGLPQWLGAGQSGAFGFFDPTRGVSRAVTLTSAGDLSGITFTIVGYDIYGRRQTQTIAGPNANTVTTAKTFKFIASITPNGSNASTVSAGTADLYGFGVRADRFTNTTIAWDASWITNNTGFTAADTTNPATAATGDVRGTFQTPTASNGTRRLYIAAIPPLANVLATTGWSAALTGLKGVTPV